MKSTFETRAHAQDVLDFIHANPERHSQEYWNENPDANGCGTSMCIAGTSDYLRNGSKRMLYPAPEAAEALGLSWPEASVLFYEMDTERAVQKLKKVVVGEEFSKEDFYIKADVGDDELSFEDYYWDCHSQGE